MNVNSVAGYKEIITDEDLLKIGDPNTSATISWSGRRIVCLAGNEWCFLDEIISLIEQNPQNTEEDTISTLRNLYTRIDEEPLSLRKVFLVVREFFERCFCSSSLQRLELLGNLPTPNKAQSQTPSSTPELSPVIDPPPSTTPNKAQSQAPSSTLELSPVIDPPHAMVLETFDVRLAPLLQNAWAPQVLAYWDIPSYDSLQKSYPHLVEQLDQIQDTWYRGAPQEDLLSMHWHGYLSFQRMAWQTPEILDFIRQEGATTLLCSALKEGKLKNTGKEGKTNIGVLLLCGYAAQIPTFLFTAKPNYQVGLPTGDGTPPTLVYYPGMGHLTTHPDIPFQYMRENDSPFSEALIDQISLAYQQFTNEIRALIPNSLPKELTVEEASLLFTILYTASSEQLIQFIAKVGEKGARNPRMMTAGNAGGSTDPGPMRAQAEGVCQYLSDAYIVSQGGLAQVLRFPLVSHALDGRHLIAICTAAEEERQRLVQHTWRFMTQCIDPESGDPTAQRLIHYRLQQAAYIVFSLLGELQCPPQEAQHFFE